MFNGEPPYSILTRPILHSDSLSAINLGKNPVAHEHTKHIEIDIHVVHKRVQRNEIELGYIPEKENLSDIFTRPLNSVTFCKFLTMLGMTNILAEFEGGSEM